MGINEPGVTDFRKLLFSRLRTAEVDARKVEHLDAARCVSSYTPIVVFLFSDRDTSKLIIGTGVRILVTSCHPEDRAFCWLQVI